LELVPVVGRVRALNVADLALVAKINDPRGLFLSEMTNITAMGVYCLKQSRKGRAEVKAKPAPVADFKDSFQFLAESFLVPVFRIVRVVAQTGRRRSFDHAIRINGAGTSMVPAP
jgi:hypothetical protein